MDAVQRIAHEAGHKPDGYRRLLEAYFPHGPWLELFACDRIAKSSHTTLVHWQHA
jgi:hypothetical protein